MSRKRDKKNGRKGNHGERRPATPSAPAYTRGSRQPRYPQARNPMMTPRLDNWHQNENMTGWPRFEGGLHNPRQPKGNRVNRFLSNPPPPGRRHAQIRSLQSSIAGADFNPTSRKFRQALNHNGGRSRSHSASQNTETSHFTQDADFMERMQKVRDAGLVIRDHVDDFLGAIDDMLNPAVQMDWASHSTIIFEASLAAQVPKGSPCTSSTQGDCSGEIQICPAPVPAIEWLQRVAIETDNTVE
ncbi:hypothetical protein FH972_023740 [Carpinus fangiana]|uniref:Uncharacterized protein n=1 Tax=Carpinus fangiana TaxID=176857 RepID=A0A5N6KW23_9ROSI|nr:hypothetical protein FH972_023740 [Carpinus fangiana]